MKFNKNDQNDQVQPFIDRNSVYINKSDFSSNIESITSLPKRNTTLSDNPGVDIEIESSKAKIVAADLFVENHVSPTSSDVILFEGQSPYQKASCLSACMFWWITPLINLTRKNQKLKQDLLGNLSPKDQVQKQVKVLAAVWENQKMKPGGVSQNGLLKSVFWSFKYQYLYLMGLNAIQSLLQISSPFIISPLIDYVKDGENAWSDYFSFWDTSEISWLEFLTPERQYGMTLALILVATQGTSYILSENVSFKQSFIGSKSTNALIALIYEKQLKLSSATNKVFSQGEIITFVQVDAQKMIYLTSQLPAVATLPFTLIMCFILLFKYLGITFFAGIGVFVISLFVNVSLSRCNARNQKKYMKKTDARVSITTECFNNIKMIKLYSWVEIFQKLIAQKRKEELSMQFIRMNFIMVTMASLYFFPMLLQCVSFTAYIASGNSIDLSLAITIITIFNIINQPIRSLPMFIGQFIEFIVAMKRIQKFLLCDEINPSLVEYGHTAGENSVQINKANFHWGVKPEESNEDQHKKVIKARKSPQITPNRQQENQSLSNFIALKNLNLNIKKGEFVCVIGDVGSGKSSLLSALIGDLLYLDTDIVNQHEHTILMQDNELKNMVISSAHEHLSSAPIYMSSSISYVQQIPWIQNKTIRDNICFGQPFIKERYWRIIDICELSRDLEILPSGDQTEIGEKGINLSGGQKARISLARAVYAQKEVILMDDPISALDANVKKKIFTKVFTGELKNKTRILVTHAVDFLHLVDKILLLKDGEIILSGKYEDIEDDPNIKELMSIHRQHKNEQQAIIDSAEKKEESVKEEVKPVEDLQQQLENSQILDQSIEKFNLEGDTDAELRVKEDKQKKKGKIMTDENEENIAISFKTYKKWFSQYYGVWFLITSQLAMFLFVFSRITSDYLIGYWAHNENGDQFTRCWYYAGLCFAFTFLVSFAIYLRSASCQLFTLRAGRRIHEEMVSTALNAPVNLYFDVTPVGRILNKFSKDLNGLETQSGWMLSATFSNFYSLIQVFIVAIFAVKWIGLVLPFVLVLSTMLVSRASNALKETVRLFSTSNSPILSYFGETIQGTSTIRAYERQQDFIEGFHSLLNDNILASQMRAGVTGWFAIQVDIMAISLMFLMTMICVLSRDYTDPVILAMLLSYTMTIQFNLKWYLVCFNSLQGNMVNADRCMKVLEIPQERVQQGQLLEGRPQWPENGNMEFREVSLKYRPTTEIVLHKLTFSVAKGEKIGVVGRTGAGKSTICLSISRIVEIFEGKIIIDGINIQDIPLNELRRRITVIPQDPTMFTGTLRFNLDPEGIVKDEEIESLLQKAQLQNILYGDQLGLDQLIQENGQNLSSGERQLICICRAILRKSKVVVLDEATANIDMVTEQKIQALITTQFKDSTMLTIAHRINTIIQSDRVLVLSFGKIKEFDSPSNLMKNPESEFSKLIQELKKEKKEEQIE